MKRKTIIIEEPVRLFSGSAHCDNKCSEIVTDISDYHAESSHDESFVLAVINLHNFISFDDFLDSAISNKRLSEYRRVLREGYYVRCINVEERNNRRNELYAINTSADERQGKMAEEYFQYPEKVPSFACPYHFHKTYGVFSPDHSWIGYMYPRFCGEVVRTYKILGHRGFMGRNNFMIQLMFDVVRDLMEHHPAVKYFEYHLMHVGNKGLQEWKKHTGFEPVRFTGQTV